MRAEQLTQLLDDLDEAGLAVAIAIEDADLPQRLLVAASLDLRRMTDTLTAHAAALAEAGKQARREAREARMAKPESEQAP